MKIHELKILPQHFNDIRDGIKTFEISNNDRGYNVGDLLLLIPTNNVFIAKSRLLCEVVYMTDYEQKNGYVVLGIDLKGAYIRPDEYCSREIWMWEVFMNKYQVALNELDNEFHLLRNEDVDKLVDVFKELVDKATPMKPTNQRYDNVHDVGGGVCKCESLVYEFHSFCPDCGQAIDWSK